MCIVKSIGTDIFDSFPLIYFKKLHYPWPESALHFIATLCSKGFCFLSSNFAGNTGQPYLNRWMGIILWWGVRKQGPVFSFGKLIWTSSSLLLNPKRIEICW